MYTNYLPIYQNCVLLNYNGLPDRSAPPDASIFLSWSSAHSLVGTKVYSVRAHRHAGPDTRCWPGPDTGTVSGVRASTALCTCTLLIKLKIRWLNSVKVIGSGWWMGWWFFRWIMDKRSANEQPSLNQVDKVTKCVPQLEVVVWNGTSWQAREMDDKTISAFVPWVKENPEPRPPHSHMYVSIDLGFMRHNMLVYMYRWEKNNIQ